MTLEEAKAKYGEISLGVWPNERKFCSIVPVPQEIGRTWIKSGTGNPVDHVYCNNDMKGPLLKALENIKERGLISELKTFDGCYIVRDVRGMPGTPSAHSYGLALDINASENPLGSPGSLSPELVQCFLDAGFCWGGHFHRMDPMHFSIGW